MQDADEFSSLLKQSFKPRSERAATEVENAVNTLVQQALADTSLIKEDVLDTIDEMIARLDEKLSAQINAIMHAPEFQQLESAWRGLNYLANNSETDATLKLRVMNVSKNELYRDLRSYPDAKWDQSPLFKKLYEAEFGQLGGEPYRLPGRRLPLRPVGRRHPPAARPRQDRGGRALPVHLRRRADADGHGLPGPSCPIRATSARSSRRPTMPAGSRCATPRTRAMSALCMPRVLSREPYGAKSIPVEEFAFEEETDGHKGEKYAWMNAAYAMAANINRAYKEYGWTVRIRGVQSGGEVINLPTHTFPTDDGGIDLKCPTEIAISDRREAELSKSGPAAADPPQEHRQGGLHRRAVALPAEEVRQGGGDGVRQSLVAHPLHVRGVALQPLPEMHGARPDRRDQGAEQLQKWLQELDHPVCRWRSARIRASAIKARKPLAAAKVEVFADEENPGYYAARFYLRPHFQLEGMDIGMSLVSRLPGQAR